MIFLKPLGSWLFLTWPITWNNSYNATSSLTLSHFQRDNITLLTLHSLLSYKGQQPLRSVQVPVVHLSNLQTTFRELGMNIMPLEVTQQSHLSFPTLSNNMVDMQSCDVEATQTSLNLGSWNHASYLIFENMHHHLMHSHFGKNLLIRNTSVHVKYHTSHV